VQDGGDLGDEQVAHHPAADPGEHAEQRRHDWLDP
jgi:hypothetical protein